MAAHSGIASNASYEDSNSSNSSNNNATSTRHRITSEGSNQPRFLERSPHTSSSSTSVATSSTSIIHWPDGYIPPIPSAATRPRGATLHSPLAFLERREVGDTGSRIRFATTNEAAVVAGGGAEVGLGSLSGGVIAAGVGRGGFLPHVRDGPEDSSSDIGDDEEDHNVCPSMLFACFPCLACFWPGRRRRTVEVQLPMDVATKGRNRSQTSLTTPLLGDLGLSPQDFPKDVKLIEVEVKAARNVPAAETAGLSADSAGTYVSLRITPVQEGVGEQTQQTSLARRVVNPRWPPPHPTITVDNTSVRTGGIGDAGAAGSGSGVIAPLPKGARTDDVVLGEGFVDLSGVFPVQQSTYTAEGKKGNSRRLSVPMLDPMKKRRTKCLVMLGLRCRRVNETIDTHEDRLYEYERWTPLAGWTSPGIRDPGKWSTLDGSVFSDNFTAVAPPARGDSEVVLPWCPFGGWEYSREEEAHSTSEDRTQNVQNETSLKDKPTLGLKRKLWMEGYAPGSEVIRRRLWRRVYLDRVQASASETE